MASSACRNASILIFRGEVTAVDANLVTVKVTGANSLGDHVVATATLTLGSPA